MTITTQEEISKIISQSYDKIPYVSYPFEYNRPENLRAVGVLFGMNPPKLETARVLELGSADGGNLMRFSKTYPKSYTLGIDFSDVEIKQGQENIKILGLKNIELKNMSIADLDESHGKFDYIICHGVYSWVPEFVREKILEISNKLLSKNGISFVSYNTLPGWNMNGTVRELMLYHANNFQNEQEKISQARSVVSFLKESLENAKTPHAKFMAEAANTVSDQEDNYIRHEYLAEENKAFYFYEFIENMKKHNLQYLGDSDFHRMFVGNLSAKTAEKLGVINDIVKTEQYIDFINNTRFRCTLLCHKDVQLSRNINYERVKKLYLSSILSTETAESNEVLNGNNEVTFYVNDNKDINIKSNDPVLKSFMYIMSENCNNPLSIDEIINLIHKKLPNFSQDQIESVLSAHIARLIFSGYFKIFSDKPVFKYEISDKPKIGDYAIFQAGLTRHNGKFWITNQVNAMLVYKDFQSHILKLLDGKHTIKDINEDVLQKLKDNVISAQRDGKSVSNVSDLTEIAEGLVKQTLEYLRINYCLVG